MKANPLFTSQPKSFWAEVRTISEAVGYTVRGQGTVKVPTSDDILRAYKRLNLRHSHLVSNNGKLTTRGRALLAYFQHRADVLNNEVKTHLMNAEQAKEVFDRLRADLKPTCPLPMNKQTGEKKTHAYLTGIVNMLIQANAGGHPCDYDPRQLTTVTQAGFPVRTLARRVDGAFTSAVNPIAIWEIKEYYHTTTFGSRVADGVYETLLDGLELQELQMSEGIHVHHYLMVDAHYTWWECGRSYLCRMIDMIHMGYVEEVLFGSEVVDRLPKLVHAWVKELEEESRVGRE